MLCRDLGGSNAAPSRKRKQIINLFRAGRGTALNRLIVSILRTVTPLLVDGISVQFGFDRVPDHFKRFVDPALQLS